MTSITTTVSNLLGTVDTAATSATSLINALGRGASMLDTYVAEQQYRQKAKTVADRFGYVQELKANSTLRIAQLETSIQSKLDNDADLKTKYAENYTRLNNLIDAALGISVSE